MQKKLFFIIVMCLTYVTVLAGSNAGLDKIKQQNEGYQTWSATFTEQQTLASGKVINLNGMLYFNRSEQMSMHYKQPATDMLIINGHDFYMARGSRKNLFNTEKNKRMLALSTTLLNSLMGNIEALAVMNDAELGVTENDSLVTVILTSRRKQIRGYSRIILSYDKKSSLLCRMQMDEYGGSSTVYTLTGHTVNEVISPDKFKIPQ